MTTLLTVDSRSRTLYDMKVTRIVEELVGVSPESNGKYVQRTEVVSVNAALIELVYPWHPSSVTVRDGGDPGCIIRFASGREISVTETIEQISHRRTIELGRPVE